MQNFVSARLSVRNTISAVIQCHSYHKTKRVNALQWNRITSGAAKVIMIIRYISSTAVIIEQWSKSQTLKATALVLHDADFISLS